MSHIHHEKSTNFISNLSHARIIKIPRISTSTSNYEFWTKEICCFLKHFIVNNACRFIKSVGHRLKIN
uniref:Serine hydroxymethyltransferase 3ic n=1 Tax=Rhizophora mucronata TaxID=61149 RepID=A0A2P2JCM5_RHIMU